MPMPDGAAPPFAWTLQPAGAIFDPPVQITYPNMSGLPAGAIAYFLSFDHDTNRFEIVATGHVTDDGANIISDPGAGIVKAGWGCNCPPYAIIGQCRKDSELCEGVEFVKVEFDEAKVNIRNLNQGTINKSVAVIVTLSQTVDLADYLTDDSDREHIGWLSNNKRLDSSILNYGEVKELNKIKAFTVTAFSKCTDGQFDSLIVVVVPKITEISFNDWFASESADNAWLGGLPALYSSLAANNEDPEPDECNFWGKCPVSLLATVCELNSFYHPGAAFEMRSIETAGSHGHQATYDNNGNLLRTGVKAGSADRGFATSSDFFRNHIEQDVKPFIWAAQLDEMMLKELLVFLSFLI